jgi:hypothetical protein
MGDGNSAAGLRDFDEAIRLEPENCRFSLLSRADSPERLRFQGRSGGLRRGYPTLPRRSWQLHERPQVLKRLGQRAEAIRGLEMYLDRDRTHGYRDHHEEQRPQTLLRDLKKKR